MKFCGRCAQGLTQRLLSTFFTTLGLRISILEFLLPGARAATSGSCGGVATGAGAALGQAQTNARIELVSFDRPLFLLLLMLTTQVSAVATSASDSLLDPVALDV